MLTKKHKLILGISLITAILIFSGFKLATDWPENKDIRKMEKRASKVWTPSQISLEKLTTLKFTSKSKHKSVYQISCEGQFLGYGYIARVFTCRPGGCSGNSSGQTGKGYEYFDYFMLLNKQLKVKHLEVLTYNATHGYEITSKNWLKQFIGYKGKNSMNYGEDIHAISGATISGNSITNDVKNTISKLRKALKKTNNKAFK